MSRKELVDAVVKAMKPYWDFLRDYDIGKVEKSDIWKLLPK